MLSPAICSEFDYINLAVVGYSAKFMLLDCDAPLTFCPNDCVCHPNRRPLYIPALGQSVESNMFLLVRESI